MILLITGRPGSGKSTLVKKVTSKLDGCFELFGFVTEELRDANGGRLGFDIVGLRDEQRGPLARLCDYASNDHDLRQKPRVGRYAVNVEEFERLAISCLENAMLHVESQERPALICIDEIGKMELLSAQFKTKVAQLLTLISVPKRKVCIKATIPSPSRADGSRGIPFIDKIAAIPGATIREVDCHNRDYLPDEITEILRTKLSIVKMPT